MVERLNMIEISIGYILCSIIISTIFSFALELSQMKIVDKKIKNFKLIRNIIILLIIFLFIIPYVEKNNLIGNFFNLLNTKVEIDILNTLYI